MSLGIVAADFTATLTDLGVSVTYRAFNGVLDEFGGTVYSYASDASKTWIFFKRSSRTDLIKWGISEIGDAYILVPTTETINYRDRIVYGGETFEYTPQCIWAARYANGVQLYKYYTLRKIA